eukprot:jgi/Chrpa1/20075/Chrysochromulina_OHIO_Genome00024034-RA
MMTPVEPLDSTVGAATSPVPRGDMGGGGDGEGGGGGGTSSTVGGVTTARTTIEIPVTFASIALALLGLLVALAIVDCTEAAVTAYVSILTSAMTLPAEIVKLTAKGACTLGVNEETSPPSSRLNPTILIAGGEGGGEGGGKGGGGEDGGRDGGGEGGGREGGGEGGGGEGGGGDGGVEGGGGEGGDGEGEGGGGEGGG